MKKHPYFSSLNVLIRVPLAFFFLCSSVYAQTPSQLLSDNPLAPVTSEIKQDSPAPAPPQSVIATSQDFLMNDKPLGAVLSQAPETIHLTANQQQQIVNQLVSVLLSLTPPTPAADVPADSTDFIPGLPKPMAPPILDNGSQSTNQETAAGGKLDAGAVKTSVKETWYQWISDSLESQTPGIRMYEADKNWFKEVAAAVKEIENLKGTAEKEESFQSGAISQEVLSQNSLDVIAPELETVREYEILKPIMQPSASHAFLRVLFSKRFGNDEVLMGRYFKAIDEIQKSQKLEKPLPEFFEQTRDSRAESISFLISRSGFGAVIAKLLQAKSR